MIISRERYLDDTTRFAVRLVLQTGSHELHSLLSDAPEDVRARLSEVLVSALDAIQAVLQPSVSSTPAKPGSASFGCGT